MTKKVIWLFSKKWCSESDSNICSNCQIIIPVCVENRIQNGKYNFSTLHTQK